MMKRKASWAYTLTSILIVVALLIQVTRLQRKVARANEVIGGLYYESYFTSIEASKHAEPQRSFRLLDRHLKVIDLVKGAGVPPEHALGIQEVATLARRYCAAAETGSDNQTLQAKNEFFDSFNRLSENEFVMSMRSAFTDEQSIITWVSELDHEYEEK